MPPFTCLRDRVETGLVVLLWVTSRSRRCQRRKLLMKWTFTGSQRLPMTWRPRRYHVFIGEPGEPPPFMDAPCSGRFGASDLFADDLQLWFWVFCCHHGGVNSRQAGLRCTKSDIPVAPCPRFWFGKTARITYIYWGCYLTFGSQRCADEFAVAACLLPLMYVTQTHPARAPLWAFFWVFFNNTCHFRTTQRDPPRLLWAAVLSAHRSLNRLTTNTPNAIKGAPPRSHGNTHLLRCNTSTQLICFSVQFIIFILADD